MIADKAYDADQRVINPLQERGLEVVIPPKSNRTVQRMYDVELYKDRHLIENFFSKIKHYRAIATRYDKLDVTFLASLLLYGSDDGSS